MSNPLEDCPRLVANSLSDKQHKATCLRLWREFSYIHSTSPSGPYLMEFPKAYLPATVLPRIIRGPALRSILLAESRRSPCSRPCHPKFVLFGLRHLGQNPLCDTMFLIQNLSKCIPAIQNANLHATRFSLPVRRKDVKLQPLAVSALKLC
jgi:hypothetical protein